MSIVRRGSTFHLRRRVPRRYRGVEPRGTVWISLHTDSGTLALAKAERAWGQMVEAWEARLAGDTGDAEARHAAALELARVRGFWLTTKPPIPDDMREAAQAKGRERYGSFVETLARRMAKGATLSGELPREVAAAHSAPQDGEAGGR